MILSKSFGYALRSVLYIAAARENGRHIQIQEVAEQLAIPRHFLGKVLKRLSKKGILDSSKGHSGGYTINEKTLSLPVMELLNLTEGEGFFNHCVAGFSKCNDLHPCPLHHQVAAAKNQMTRIFTETHIGDLLAEDKAALIKSLIMA